MCNSCQSTQHTISSSRYNFFSFSIFFLSRFCSFSLNAGWWFFFCFRTPSSEALVSLMNTLCLHINMQLMREKSRHNAINLFTEKLDAPNKNRKRLNTHKPFPLSVISRPGSIVSTFIFIHSQEMKEREEKYTRSLRNSQPV